MELGSTNPIMNHYLSISFFLCSLALTFSPQNSSAMEFSLPNHSISNPMIMKAAIESFKKDSNLDAAKVFIETYADSVIKKKQLIRDYAEYSWKHIEELGNLNERENTYNHFLRISHSLFPEANICGYFHQCYEKNILDLNGINLLLLHMKNKGPYHGKLEESQAIELSELPSVLQDLERKNWLGERSLIVRPAGKHVTPIFFRFQSQKREFIVSDSLGESDFGYNYGTQIEKLVRQSISNEVPIQFFKLQLRRQNDGISCAIFSIRDLLEHTKMNWFNYVKESEQLQNDGMFKLLLLEPDCRTKEDSSLLLMAPSGFFKVNQLAETFSKIQLYNNLNPAIGSDKINRTYVRSKAYKYFKIILEKVLMR